MLSIKTAVAGQVLMRLSNYHGVVSVSDGTTVWNYGTTSTETYHGGNPNSYELASFDAEAGKQYYIYASTHVSNIGAFTISFYPTGNTTTAISENTEWDFSTPVYHASYKNITKDNLYLGEGTKQKYAKNNKGEVTTRLLFLGQGNTSTGANTIQFKIPANKAIGLQIKPSCYYGALILTDGTNTLQDFTAGDTYHNKDVYINIPSSESERTLYLYTTKTDVTEGNNIGVFYIKANISFPVTVSSGINMGTLVAPYPLDFSDNEGIKAYTATSTGVNGSAVVFTRINKVPAYTPVLLYKDGGATSDISFVNAEETDTPDASNMLKAGTGAAVATTPAEGTTNYILSKSNTEEVYGFFYANNTVVPTTKAYLQVTGGASSRLSVIFDDQETTGIGRVEGTTTKDATIYNLNGQRVNAPAKGLYIVNGKKIIIK